MTDLQALIVLALQEIEIGTSWGITDGGWGLTCAGERVPVSSPLF